MQKPFALLFIALVACIRCTPDQSQPAAPNEPARPTVSKDSLAAIPPATALTDTFYKHLVGSVGRHQPVYVELWATGSQVYGQTFMWNEGILPFQTTASIDAQGQVRLPLQVLQKGKPITMGEIVGRFTNSQTLEGTLQTTIATNSGDAVRWQETYTDGSVPLQLMRYQSTEGDCKERCLRFDLLYPMVTRHTSRPLAADSIDQFNQLLLSQLGTFMEVDKATARSTESLTANQLTEDIKRQFAQAKKDVSSWHFTLQPNIYCNLSNVLSVGMEGERQNGGARPEPLRLFTNLNTATGKPIRLEDVLKKGYQQPLVKLLKQRFRQAYTGEVVELAQSKLKVSPHFYFTPTGITFVYPPGQLAPPQAGGYEIALKYSDVSEWIAPQSLLDVFLPKPTK